MPERLCLRAGPLTLVFEPERAFARYVKLGEREVLRGIYAAVRDHNWETIEPKISDLNINVTEGGFRITFNASCKKREVDFLWQGALTGSSDGKLTFSFDGRARSTFKRNRIGFCVLHPVKECPGQPCGIEHPGGSSSNGIFPPHISPHQPFKNMRAISHEVMPGVMAEVRFSGDVFEMEDQRNWTDASYKTYCTPLELPFPMEVAEGTRIEQSVTLRLSGAGISGQARGGAPSAAASRPVEIVCNSASSVLLPALGLGVASHGEALSEREIKRLKALRLAHLRVDLTPSDDRYQETLRRAAQEAQALGARLEIALFLSDNGETELQRVADAMRGLPARVARWLIFRQREKSTGAQWGRMARRLLPASGAETQFGAGTNAYFTELNRGRPALDSLDFAAYSINPQVHAFDDASLVETLGVQALTVESARTFCGTLPIIVSPVTLKPRFNPNSTASEALPAPGELPSQVDARQALLFGAAWTLGSVKYLSEAGAAALTYYETSGWRGIMETERGSPLPAKFHSVPGGVFPLYHVLADLAEFTGGRVLPSISSDPLRVDGMILEMEGRRRVLLANMSAEAQPVRLRCPALGAWVRVKKMDAENVEFSMRTPESYRAAPGLLAETDCGVIELSLPSHATARIDAVARPNVGLSDE